MDPEAVVELLDRLHPQDKLILVEALTYWAYDAYEAEDKFDPNDPRRNRAAELAQELFRSDDIPEGELEEIVNENWPREI